MIGWNGETITSRCDGVEDWSGGFCDWLADKLSRRGRKGERARQRGETDAVSAEKIVLESGKSTLARDRFSYAAERRSDKSGDRAAVAEPKADKPSTLTNLWNQRLAVAMRKFDFMKQFSVFATLAAASGGSALSREAYDDER